MSLFELAMVVEKSMVICNQQNDDPKEIVVVLETPQQQAEIVKWAKLETRTSTFRLETTF